MEIKDLTKLSLKMCCQMLIRVASYCLQLLFFLSSQKLPKTSNYQQTLAD